MTAALYLCATVGCENTAVGVYQGPTRGAVYGVCAEHAKRILARTDITWVHEPLELGSQRVETPLAHAP